MHRTKQSRIIMNKLLALPIPGESFLLRRGEHNILVDGGYGSQALISALSAPGVGVNHLHIVVCTHADRDHAGGLTDLLDRAPSLQVDELWLPGAWSETLPGLLRNPRRVMDALIAELEEFAPDDAGSPDQDDDAFEARVHARIAKQRRNARGEQQNTRFGTTRRDGKTGLTWLKEQAENVELDAAYTKVFANGRRSVRYRAAKMQLNIRWTAFWIGLIDTAERIRKIAVQAIRHDVTVRWFDFGEFSRTHRASGGAPGLLLPLNSVELTVPPPPAVALSYVARLTPVNEECLVFFSPSMGWPGDLGVVFTGDSPLGHGTSYEDALLDWPPDPTRWVVATTPHHGSENNAPAYGHLSSRVLVALWLRSGGTSKHPGQTFRKLHPQSRACTHCPHLNLPLRAAEVQLTDYTGWPLFRVSAHDCRCR
ncbi:hypothetical protein GO294_00219 [Ralstonia solanacearum]|nr:hypothetical protein [Ralstonia solanacearum]